MKSDGRTAYERLKGRELKGGIVDTFETVQFKVDKDHRGKLNPQTSIGVCLGKSLTSDEHLIGTNLGIRRCRSVWRRAGPKRWDMARLKAVVGTPWQPKGDSTMVPGQGSEPLGLERRERSVYITLERQLKHGPTPNCPGCHCDDENPKPHTKECRERFSKLYPRTSAEEVGKESEMVVDAGGSAQQLSSSEPLKEAVRPAPIGEPSRSSKEPAPIREAKRGSSQATEPSSKKQKEAKSSGEKQAAELALEEAIAQDVTLSELMRGFLTLHEVPLVAGYPETGTVDQAFDERTGEELPIEKVRRARGRELDKMQEHSVKRDMTWPQARPEDREISLGRWLEGTSRRS